MRLFLTCVGRYFRSLVKSWIFWCFNIVAAVTFAIGAYRPALLLPREAYAAILLVGFLCADIEVFYRQELIKESLKNRIAELEASEPNILLEVTETGFSPSHRKAPCPFPEAEVDPYGFDEHGLPGWGVIWVSLKGENRGWEGGIPVCEFDRDSTSLPSLFDPGFVLDREASDMMFRGSPRTIEGRTPFAAHLQLDVRITERDPQVFAQALKSLTTYRVVINYHTEPIVGESSPHAGSLPIEGDFEEFRRKVLDHWRNSRNQDLAQIAESQ